jgi:hypothetical protein
LQQPTATTQAASPAPEQPYMGNYLKWDRHAEWAS